MSVRKTRRAVSKIDREAVVEAAMAIADREGLDAVSFRRLADQFEVTPMALYWHFDDKEALLGALADRLWADIGESLRRSLRDLTEADDWEQLRVTVATLVEVMRGHPEVADLMPSRVMETEAGLDVTELTLGYLGQRGFSREQAAELARFVLCSAVMMVNTQPGIDIPEPGERAEIQRRKQIALASLPHDRYPHIVASAHALTDCDEPNDYFTVGCDVIVAGVSAQAPARRGAAKGRR
jgi:TetR/AcrR family transcriptional regulator, tetracycline repressor protein